MAFNGNLYDSDNGKVFCNKNIMLSIINLAAKEISGVSSLVAKFVAVSKDGYLPQTTSKV